MASLSDGARGGVQVAGVEEVLHQSTAADKQFMGGRRPYSVTLALPPSTPSTWHARAMCGHAITVKEGWAGAPRPSAAYRPLNGLDMFRFAAGADARRCLLCDQAIGTVYFWRADGGMCASACCDAHQHCL